MIPRPRDFTAGMFKYKTTPEGAPPSDDERMDAVGGACRLGRSVIGMLSLNRPTAKRDELLQAPDLIFGFLFATLMGGLDWPFGCTRKSIATVMNITIWLFGAMRTRICCTAQCGIFAFSFKQILATKSHPFHLEMIRCLESQSAARGHHRMSAH
jgi:hypothetical protein